MTDEWKPFDDAYEKRWYEVLAGERILQHFWPNGGLLIGSGFQEGDPKGWNLRLGYDSGVKIRSCRCEKCTASNGSGEL